MLDETSNCIYKHHYLMKNSTQMTTPKVIAETCIGSRVRLLNRVITRIYDDALRPLGITIGQLNILVVIAKRETARPAEICGALKIEVSTLSRNIERMRARGWIEVLEDSEDARAHQFQLSRQGQDLLTKAFPAWEKAQQKAGELMGESGIEALDKAADRARELISA